MFPSVLLLLALDERDETIVQAFLGLAARLGVKRLSVAHFLSVDPIPSSFLPSVKHLGTVIPPELERWADVLRAALPDVAVQVHVEAGSHADALDSLQERIDADLLVIGRQPLDDDDDAWGAVGRNAMRHARCSALVVPHGWRGPSVGAVVGMDFSEHALQALKTALALFEDVVCLYQYDPRHNAAGSMTETEFALELAGNARTTFERDVLPQVGERRPELEIVGTRRASDALVARADGDHVVVVGSRGLSRFAAMLLGSTAERIAGRAASPVLVVRRKGEEMGFIEGVIRR